MNKVYIVLIASAFCQAASDIGSSCVLKSSGTPGKCKLITDCLSARDEVVKHHRLPQTCGFQETQPIVCCPRDSPPGVISKRKCKQYSSYDSGPKDQSNKNPCGHTIVKRIVGGTTASRTEFPHMALLGYEAKWNSNIQWYCGGTIISENFILTAAHCLSIIHSGSVKYVKVGVTSLNDTIHMQQYAVDETIAHPQYRPYSAYYDIALIKLEKSISINQYARPACLYVNKDTLPEKAIATGWGKISFLGETSDDLLKVTLDITDYDICQKTYTGTSKLANGISEASQFCAGSGKDGKDTCAGDAGGPLQIYHEENDVECMFDVVGITSFGKYCGISPGVYTKVSFFIQWIEDNVWKEA